MLGQSGEQLAGLDEVVERRQRTHFSGRYAPDHVLRTYIARMMQAGRGDKLFQGLERVLVEHLHALGFVRNVEFFPARWILRSHAGRTAVGMAVLRLDAAEREHE